MAKDIYLTKVGGASPAWLSGRDTTNFKEIWLNQGGASPWGTSKIKEVWEFEEYFVDGDPAPKYRWIKVFWNPPTVSPSSLYIEARANWDIYCEVAAYSGTYPTYQVVFELWSSDETEFIAQATTNVGDRFHIFDLPSTREGEQVKFRARFVDDGKHGPNSGWSSSVFVSGGLG